VLIVFVILFGGIMAFASGAIARRYGIFLGAVLPALMIGFTVLSANTKVHPEGSIGQGALVLFVLMPLCVGTILGWGLGLWLRYSEARRRQAGR
jgi:hypothetical protein